MLKIIKIFRIILVIFMVFNTGLVLDLMFGIDGILSDLLVFTLIAFMYETRKIYK